MAIWRSLFRTSTVFFPTVSITKSTTFEDVTPALEDMFSLYDIPTEIKTDNGSPFQSEKFKEFARHYGFKHRRITP